MLSCLGSWPYACLKDKDRTCCQETQWEMQRNQEDPYVSGLSGAGSNGRLDRRSDMAQNGMGGDQGNKGIRVPRNCRQRGSATAISHLSYHGTAPHPSRGFRRSQAISLLTSTYYVVCRGARLSKLGQGKSRRLRNTSNYNYGCP